MPTTYAELIRWLRTNGYTDAETISRAGNMMVRGDSITLWPAGQLALLRLHFFGEAIEYVEQESPDGSWANIGTTIPTIWPNALHTPYGDVTPGDYIVHPYHGVGIFQSLVAQVSHEGVMGIYIALEYAGNDRLLVPLDKQAELMPYIGTRTPRLTRLYSTAWKRTKERIQRDLIRVARGLLKIYAERQLHPRQPVVANTEWAEILDAGVPFTLTPDQSRGLQETIDDLSQGTQPMDRLVCGDVGFGKTEVALRAAAQVIANGRQVAFIAPTTVLAEQHYQLVCERFKDLPVTIARLSRLTKSTDAETLAAIEKGTVDIVIGTHRLLGGDLAWKHLGLLIIDEEQKFGVSQKESLKNLRPHLDVLSLSATPIPRTLSMSLSGLRGLSILRTPPGGRKPIKTIVETYTDGLVQQALIQEIDRGGTVYVIHNRVQSLPMVTEYIRKLLRDSGHQECTIDMAHGQMSELALAKAMGEFMAGRTRVLVASSIVEHGLDSPHANTLIVLHAERFGLSDLYQLRGRVGRRTTQAYAYFCVGGVGSDEYAHQDELGMNQQGIAITKNARQRLQALEEADQLGSGWSIAMRDLEIRGGGNVLGNEQSGNMEAIGLLLYGQLLQEEIGRQARALKINLFNRKTYDVD
jgi:transcription-repair coupling factor (superfamily II helicase)